MSTIQISHTSIVSSDKHEFIMKIVFIHDVRKRALTGRVTDTLLKSR